MKPQLQCQIFCLQSRKSLEDLIAMPQYLIRSCKKFNWNALREEIEDENQLYQECFCYLMEFYKLQCQSNYNEAVQMFDVLMSHA